ncbi:hypothetical protein GCM10028807_38940 [Spirosoma daeguense]
MSSVRKSNNPAENATYDREYWWSKTPEERLVAALKLIRRAKSIYYANPNNPPLGDGRQVLKSDKPIQRTKLPLIHYLLPTS